MFVDLTVESNVSLWNSQWMHKHGYHDVITSQDVKYEVGRIESNIFTATHEQKTVLIYSVFFSDLLNIQILFTKHWVSCEWHTVSACPVQEWENNTEKE